MNTTRTAAEIAALSNLELDALAAEAHDAMNKAHRDIADLDAGKLPGFVGLPADLLESIKAQRLAGAARLEVEGPIALAEIATRRAAVLRGNGRRRITYGRIH